MQLSRRRPHGRCEKEVPTRPARLDERHRHLADDAVERGGKARVSAFLLDRQVAAQNRVLVQNAIVDVAPVGRRSTFIAE